MDLRLWMMNVGVRGRDAGILTCGKLDADDSQIARLRLTVLGKNIFMTIKATVINWTALTHLTSVKFISLARFVHAFTPL